MPDSLRLLVVGAHPDDCEYKAAGLAALYRRAGHRVKFVSVTDGRSGHHRIAPAELAPIRLDEARASGRVCGVEYEIFDVPDGSLLPSLEMRKRMISLIREFQPDLLLTHRPNDYHPDHRYTSQLVCDAAYLVTVPPVVHDVPALRDDPVIMYLSDDFKRPYEFSPDVIVDVEPVLEQMVDMLDCHKSQFYDWLAYNHHYEDQLPPDDSGRRDWLLGRTRERLSALAERFRDWLIANCGEEPGRAIGFVEAFEHCEYGAPLTAECRRRLFSFSN